MNARRAVLEILEKFDSRHLPLDVIIDRVLNKQRIDHRDRRLIFEIVYGILRNRLRLDFIIDSFLNEPASAPRKRLIRLLELGVYQIVYLDKIPDHAAVNETVNLAKEFTDTHTMTGLVNAVLRNVIKNKARLPQPGEHTGLGERLSIEFSHPLWLVRRWLERFGLDKTKKLLTFNNIKPDVHLRRKRKGISRQQFEVETRSICEPACGYLNLFHRLSKTAMIESIDLLQEGRCTVQSPSSGWVVALCDIGPGDRILDMCASPGGKATLMAELAGENGAVCACDATHSRIGLLAETITRMHLPSIFTIQCDGRHLPFNGLFDKVLLDAPCSGTGVMHRHPDARWIRNESQFESVTALQRELLESAARQVSAGGFVVYATCSIEPEENAQQIKAFLERHPEFEIDRLRGIVPETYIDDKGFLSITPFEHKMDGMFAARLRKKRH
jgi:16S rRNA (cytosine967-C5)-methyltransferase